MLEHEGNPVNGRSGEADGGHVDEGAIHAWLDGQLSIEEVARIEQHVAGCGACSALVAEARGYIAASTRILNALDGVPAQVVPQAAGRPHRWQLRIAAAIVVMGLGTAVFLRGSHSPLSAAYQERAADRLSGSAGQSLPRDTAATPPPRTLAPVPQGRTQSAPMRQAVPLAAPASKQAPIVSTAPSSSAVGGALRYDSGARDLAVPAPVDTTAPERRAREAEADAAAHDGSARTRALVSGAPALANRAHAVPRVGPVTDSTAVTRSVPMAAAPVPVTTPPEPTIENALQGQVSGRVNVRGRVVEADEQRAPVQAAQVLIPGTMIGQSTTDSGSFNISVPADAKTLTVRRIGYMAENVPLTPGTTDYTIALKKDVLRLESQVVTGAAANSASQNAAAAAKVTVSSGGAGAPTGGLRLTLAGSRCQGQVVLVPSGVSGPGVTDSIEARLTPTLSQSLDQPGFVVQFVPDTAAAPAGSWQPIGRDSALVKLHGLRVASETRVACGRDQP